VRIQLYESIYFTALTAAVYELDRHYFGDRGATHKEIESSLKNGMLGPESGVRVLVAIEAEEVAGLATFTLLYPAPEQRGQLFKKDLFVRERWRRRRVGEELMQFLARYAMQHNCVRFDWTTENTNTGAMTFYQRLGAKHVAEKVYYRLTENALHDLAEGKASSSSPSDA
jgi:GNAT superfamily N-acetyltransferase